MTDSPTSKQRLIEALSASYTEAKKNSQRLGDDFSLGKAAGLNDAISAVNGYLRNTVETPTPPLDKHQATRDYMEQFRRSELPAPAEAFQAGWDAARRTFETKCAEHGVSLRDAADVAEIERLCAVLCEIASADPSPGQLEKWCNWVHCKARDALAGVPDETTTAAAPSNSMLSNDIVTCCRAHQHREPLLRQAADEIERLRAALECYPHNPPDGCLDCLRVERNQPDETSSS
jgi:hypothetical protein